MSRPQIGFRLLAIGAATAFAMVSASPGKADTLTPDTWTTFYFDGTGSALYGSGGTVDTTFTTGTLSANADLLITDAFYAGDNFNVTATGGPAPITITTPSVGTCSDPSTCTFYGPSTQYPDPQSYFTAALHDPNFSSGEILLLAGYSYDITGTVKYSPFGGGQGGFELVAATPLPATWTMMLAALIGFGYCAWRRSPKNSTPIAAA
jgi:hypothetical protein